MNARIYGVQKVGAVNNLKLNVHRTSFDLYPFCEFYAMFKTFDRIPDPEFAVESKY